MKQDENTVGYGYEEAGTDTERLACLNAASEDLMAKATADLEAREAKNRASLALGLIATETAINPRAVIDLANEISELIGKTYGGCSITTIAALYHIAVVNAPQFSDDLFNGVTQ